jgi:hypothetical protein
VGFVPGGIRTPNLLIRSQKLYPVELQALSGILDLRWRIGQHRLLEEAPNRRPESQRPPAMASLWSLRPGLWDLEGWVADGTRTRNNQNHNLELYH